jgi:hypothetical protein
MSTTHRTAQGAHRYVVSDTNPNPTESCACYPGGHGEDSGGPFVVWTASEPIDAPHTVTCASCVRGACAALEGETLSTGNAVPVTVFAPEPVTVGDGPHVNPVGDDLAEATRLLEEQELAKLDEDPVI